MMKQPSGQWSVVSGQRRKTSSQWLVVSGQQDHHGRRTFLPTTDHRPPTTSYFLPTTGHWPLATAFTLVELMISLAMMIVLMYAVNFIFSSVGKATGAAQTISAINRNVQAAATVMNQDFAGIALDGPYLLIHSERLAAFRTKPEQLADLDYNPNDTPSNIDSEIRSYNLSVPNQDDTSQPRPIIGGRNHRLDWINFFARGNFPRQTGNDGVYIANQSGGEAYIWYGHLKAEDSTGAINKYVQPGTDATNGGTLNSVNNPNNFYATQWNLGRVVMVLSPEVSKPLNATTPGDPATGVWDNTSPVPQSQVYIRRNPAAAVTSLSPFEQVSSLASVGTFQVQWTRYDLAGTSLSGFKTILTNALTNTPALQWWDGNHLSYRFQGNQYPTKPLDSAGAARTVPIFLPACTNFIVEFAGDFVHQTQTSATTFTTDNWYGDPTANPAIPKTDGQIDYYLDSTGAKHVQWYGFPRKTTSINPTLSLTNGDVVPVRDMVKPFNPPANIPVFERVVPTFKADYAITSASQMAVNATYVCAWGPDSASEPKPSMIRIVFTVDDPSGNIQEPPTYEYVFKIQ